MTAVRALWLTLVAGIIAIESAKLLWQQVLRPQLRGQVE